MHPLIQNIEKESKREKELPSFRVGDVIDVHVRIKEGDKERTQVFTGTVIKISGAGRGVRATFTVRRIVASEGVERTFPFHSPVVQTIKVKRPGKVRRSRLYYLRDRVGKATKVKERRVDTKPVKKKGAKKTKKTRKDTKAAAESEVKEPVTQ